MDRKLLIGAAAVAAVAAPPAAQASTVYINSIGLTYVDDVSAQGRGAETNTLRVGYAADTGEYVFVDTTTPIHAGAGCRAGAAGEARCAAPPGVLAFVSLGGGDDIAEFDASVPGGAPRWAVRGGGGDDRIAATSGDDLLSGGPGADTIDGGGGADVLDGETGADALLGGAGDDRVHDGADSGDRVDGGPGDDRLVTGDRDDGPDLLAGGDGRDTVWYYGRSRSVSIDLSRSDGQGEAGENDALTGVEAAVGGAGDDRFAGGPGADHFDGDRGRDTFLVRGGGTDQVRCSDDTDRVEADWLDRVSACEKIARAPRLRVRSLSATPTPVRFTVRSVVGVPAGAAAGACRDGRVEVVARRGRRTLARRHAALRARGCGVTVRLALPRAAGRVRVLVRFAGSAGLRATTRWRVVRVA
jgi:hypothetical protein